ncbi:hypothetical protein MMC12_002851 [Toensbergia leucococca]|nr:hypothetical protein [Toensbergia leucococca]
MDLPMKWQAGQCNAILIPRFDAIGTPWYDTGTYIDISIAGAQVIHTCLSGGRDWTGNNDLLNLILFAPGSLFSQRVNEAMETGTLFDYTGLDPRKPNPPNVKPGPGTGPGTPTKPEAATNPKSTTEVDRFRVLHWIMQDSVYPLRQWTGAAGSRAQHQIFRQRNR